MFRAIAFFAAAVLAVAPGAHAQNLGNPFYPNRCWDTVDTFAHPDAAAPQLVNATLARFPGLGFHVCKDRAGGTHYRILMPELGRRGVCVLREVEVFAPRDPATIGTDALDPRQTADDIHWGNPPSPWKTMPFAGQKGESTRIDGVNFPSEERQQMARAHAGCPAADSRAFVYTDNISETDFAAIAHYWSKITSSPRVFASVLNRLGDAGQCADPLSGHIRGRMWPQSRIQLRDWVLNGHAVQLTGLGHRDRDYTAGIGLNGSAQFTAAFVQEDGAFRLKCVGPVWVA